MLKPLRLLTTACISALLPLSGYATLSAGKTTQQADAGTLQAHHENVLGTSLEITVQAPTRAAANRAEGALLAEIDRQTRLLSAWDPQSEFSRWQSTHNRPVKLSPELLGTLGRFDHWQHQTGNALNASAEAANRLWRVAAFHGKAPLDAELIAAAEQMRQPHWSLDIINGTATHLTGTPLALASFVKSRIIAAAAEAALRAGATGVMLNSGGDIVTRGRLTQRVDVADPRSDAENDAALDTVVLQGEAIATSGGYRRNVVLDGVAHSHLIDPRTALPAAHILSSTVIAPDAETAGALATAFSILSPAESARLARQYPGSAYLLITQNGERIQSPGWARYQQASLHAAAYRIPMGGQPPAPAVDAGWNQNYELLIKLDLPRIDSPRYRRPFVAVWIEDENKYPVRTVALWFQKPRWLPELKTWYRDDRLRNLSEGTDLSRTISSATRGPGSYALKWDGKDNEGKLVKPGKYTVCVEASRQDGGYGLARHPMDFNGIPQQASLPAQPEVGTVALDYRKR